MLSFIGRILYTVGQPFIKTRLRGTVRSYVLLRVGDEVLLTQNVVGQKDVWRLPGGGLKGNETPEQACARELKEETGIPIVPKEVKRIKGTPVVSSDGYSYFLFTAELPEKPQLQSKKFETHKVGFVAISELSRLQKHETLKLAIDSLSL